MSTKVLLFMIFLLLPLFAPLSAMANRSLRLSAPVDCRIGETCWIVNYVDVDPEPDSASDFHCGHLTYDAHHGTDIGIADWKTMEKGVAVHAAAGGTVLRVRNESEDRLPSPEDIKNMKAENKGCGNGVVLKHGYGWQTIYCHMKQDSIVVKPDQTVKAGDKIGEIGHSGIAEFPHLHFGAFFESHTIDPFTGFDDMKGCAQNGTSLWKSKSAINYEPVSLYAAGFKADVPDFDAIKQDISSPDTLPANIPALTFWAGLYGAVKGDMITLEIQDSYGRIFATRTTEQEKNRARQFYYVGKKIRNNSLVPGTYTGTLRLTRISPDGNSFTRRISREITVK